MLKFKQLVPKDKDNYRDEAYGKGENPELNYVQIVPIKNTGGMVK